MTIQFAKRKHDRFRRGSTATIPEDPVLEPNVPALFKRWRAVLRPVSPSDFLFPNFSFAHAKQGVAALDRALPLDYSVLSSSLALWMGDMLGMSPEEYSKRFGTRSGRAGGTSAALAAGVPVHLVRKHGDWSSDAIFRYAEFDAEQNAQAARAIATAPTRKRLHPDSSTPSHQS